MIDTSAIRNKVLLLAFQGKLTEQMIADGCVHNLYEEIQHDKNGLIELRKIKREKTLAQIMESEIPYDIPDNWKWVRLNDIGSWSAGATPSRRNREYYDGEIPWVKTGELTNGEIYRTEECITELALKNCSLRMNPIGSVLIAMYGATIGKVAILGVEATSNQACCACITYKGVYNKYLFYYLIAHKSEFMQCSHGGAQPNISKEIIINELFPLPPYEEQVRIVDIINKVYTILDIIDEYQIAYNTNVEILKNNL